MAKREDRAVQTRSRDEAGRSRIKMLQTYTRCEAAWFQVRLQNSKRRNCEPDIRSLWQKNLVPRRQILLLHGRD